jgi:hypothetical protein
MSTISVLLDGEFVRPTVAGYWSLNGFRVSARVIVSAETLEISWRHYCTRQLRFEHSSLVPSPVGIVHCLPKGNENFVS